MKISTLSVFAALLLLSSCSGIYYKKGDDYLAQQKYDEAVMEFKELVEFNPDDYAAYLRLGNAYRGKKDYDAAIMAYNEALRLNPGWEEAVFRLRNVKFDQGKLLETKGQIRDAVETYEKLKDEHPDFVPVYLALAQLFERNNKIDKAVELYEQLSERAAADVQISKSLQNLNEINERASVLFKEANKYYEGKYFYEAAESFQKVIAIKPDHIEAKYLYSIALGRHHLKRGSEMEMWQAIGAFGNALAVKSDAAEPHFYLAQAFEKKDKSDYDTPVEYYKKVIELEPESEFAKQSREKIKEITELKKKMEAFLKKKKGGGGAV